MATEWNAATQSLIEAVKAHALANYNEGGWDYVVEAFTDDEIAEYVGKARTVDGAIAKVKAIANLLADRRLDLTPVEGWDY